MNIPAAACHSCQEQHQQFPRALQNDAFLCHRRTGHARAELVRGSLQGRYSYSERLSDQRGCEGCASTPSSPAARRTAGYGNTATRARRRTRAAAVAASLCLEPVISGHSPATVAPSSSLLCMYSHVIELETWSQPPTSLIGSAPCKSKHQRGRKSRPRLSRHGRTPTKKLLGSRSVAPPGYLGGQGTYLPMQTGSHIAACHGS